MSKADLQFDLLHFARAEFYDQKLDTSFSFRFIISKRSCRIAQIPLRPRHQPPQPLTPLTIQKLHHSINPLPTPIHPQHKHILTLIPPLLLRHPTVLRRVVEARLARCPDQDLVFRRVLDDFFWEDWEGGEDFSEAGDVRGEGGAG